MPLLATEPVFKACHFLPDKTETSTHTQSKAISASTAVTLRPAHEPGHHLLSRLLPRKVRLSALSGCWRQVYVFKLLGLLQPDLATGSALYGRLSIFATALSCCLSALGLCMLGYLCSTLTFYQSLGAWRFRLRWSVYVMGPCHCITYQ